MRKRDRAKRAANTEDKAAAHQQRRERWTSETEEQREARLQRMRITYCERMAVETEEQREARLQRMSANQSDRLAAETEEQREARLQRMRIAHTGIFVVNTVTIVNTATIFKL